MKLANSVKIRIFSHEEEDDPKILEAFLALFPFNLGENKAT